MNGLPSESFLMVLALRNFLDSHSVMMNYKLKSKSKYRTFVESLLDMLCKDTVKRQLFLDYGGDGVDVVIDDGCRVIDIVRWVRWPRWKSCSGSP